MNTENVTIGCLHCLQIETHDINDVEKNSDLLKKCHRCSNESLINSLNGLDINRSLIDSCYDYYNLLCG